jgi:hypothetical protein
MAKVILDIDGSKESKIAKKLIEECGDIEYKSREVVGTMLPSSTYQNSSYRGLEGITGVMGLLNCLSKNYRKAYRKVFKIKGRLRS